MVDAYSQLDRVFIPNEIIRLFPTEYVHVSRSTNRDVWCTSLIEDNFDHSFLLFLCFT